MDQGHVPAEVLGRSGADPGHHAALPAAYQHLGALVAAGPRQSRLVAHDRRKGSAVTSLAAAIMAVVAMSSACFTGLSS